MNQPQTTNPQTPKAPSDQAFVIGEKRSNDPVVGVAIAINCDVRLQARSLSCNVPLHELPLMMRMYTALGGTVKPRADWIPANKRRSKLTHKLLQQELNRLSIKYVIPLEVGKHDIMGEVYGATGAERLMNLRNKMTEADQLWRALESRAMAEIREAGVVYHPLEAEALIGDRINEKDLEGLLRKLDPQLVTADTIELEGIEDDDSMLEPAGADAKPAAAKPLRVLGGDIDRAFGQDADPLDAGDEPPAELSDVDLLIADLRHDGMDEDEATKAALVITTVDGKELGDRLRADGFKGRQLAAIVKRAREYHAATKTPAPSPAG